MKMTIYCHTLKQSETAKDFFNSIANSKLGNGSKNIFNIKIINNISYSSIRSGDIIILYADDNKDLNFYIDNLEILNNYRIILILEKYNKEYVDKAHMLHPRYIEFTGNGSTKVPKVIKKMLASHPIETGKNDNLTSPLQMFAQGGVT